MSQKEMRYRYQVNLVSCNHGFKKRTGERTEKRCSSRFYGPTGGRTGDVINNFIYNFKII
jgi:hypothetical protein